MRDNISAGAGRDWLAERYPDALERRSERQRRQLRGGRATPPAPTAQLAAKGEDPEQRLSRDQPRSQHRPARHRHHRRRTPSFAWSRRRGCRWPSRASRLLSSMVMLGINRIVVTDGTINAKVVFDMRAEDKAKRKYTASMSDTSSAALPRERERKLWRLVLAHRHGGDVRGRAGACRHRRLGGRRDQRVQGRGQGASCRARYASTSRATIFRSRRWRHRR